MSYKNVNVKQLSSTNPRFNYVNRIGVLRYDDERQVIALFYPSDAELRGIYRDSYHTSTVQSVEYFTLEDKPCLRLNTINSIYEYELLSEDQSCQDAIDQTPLVL